MLKKRDCTSLFKTPFSRRYWCLAADEFKDIRMILIAALVVAVRVALRPYSNSLQIAPNLTINLSFWINAAGSMIYGPLVGLLSGAVSDTLSCIIFPSGAYFFPFIFVEMLGCFVFGIFLYRADLSAIRIIFSRVAVVVTCNFIVNPIVMVFYYRIFYPDSTYTLYSVTLTVLKALLTFPFEALILIFFISAVINPLKKMKLLPNTQNKIKITKGLIVLIVCIFVVAVVLFVGLKFFGFYDFLKSAVKAFFNK